MKLTPVESSHIAAIGYLEDERVLLVRYKDGALYARTGVPVESWYDFEGSVSKGGWLNHHREYSAILISKGAAVDSQSTRAVLAYGPQNDQASHMADAQRVPPAGPLNVIDEDASACCRKHFEKAITSNADMEITCTECGTVFRQRMVGGIKHWAIFPLFAVHRNR